MATGRVRGTDRARQAPLPHRLRDDDRGLPPDEGGARRERLGTAQRRPTLPILAGERGGVWADSWWPRASQAQRRGRGGGRGGPAGRGDMAEIAPSSPKSGRAVRAREQRPWTRVRLHSAPSVPACDPGQVPEALPATVPTRRLWVKELSLKAGQRPGRVRTQGQVEGSMCADVHTEGTHVIHVGELDLQGCEQGARWGLHGHRDDLGVQDSRVPRGQPVGHAGVRSPSPRPGLSGPPPPAPATPAPTCAQMPILYVCVSLSALNLGSLVLFF